MLDLSIIIPVYQVERYIRPCVESIFRQGLDESRFEVIIVNDCTKDRSMEMIADIIQQHTNITVINHPENLSLSVARNTGIDAAKGKYLFMPDSDDLLIENSLPPVLEKALELEVDLAVAGFFPVNDKNIDSFKVTERQKFTFKEKIGEQLFLEDLNAYQCYVWRTLYRRDFILENQIRFIPGINYQDVPFTHECHLKTKRSIVTPWPIYIYRVDRPGAATTVFSVKKSRSYSIAIGSTWNLSKMPSLSAEARYKVEDDVYHSFCTMMFHTVYAIEKTSERIQILQILKKEAPDLNFRHGFFQKLTTFMYRYLPIHYLEAFYLYYQISYKRVPLIKCFKKYMITVKQ